MPRFPPHRPIASEPLWRPQGRLSSAELDPLIRPWLLDDGSLTGRLLDLNAGTFRVQRLYQGWQVPLTSERRLLELPSRQLALIREVVLSLDDRPVVFARSVFPVSSLTGPLLHLRRLKNKALGAILFQHPGMQRSPFELTLLPPRNNYLPDALCQQGSTWGRRSRFDIERKALMVSEFFLADFSPWRAVLPVHRTQRGKVSTAIMRAKH